MTRTLGERAVVTPLLAQRVGERLGELGRERKHRAVCVRGERKSHRSGRMIGLRYSGRESGGLRRSRAP